MLLLLALLAVPRGELFEARLEATDDGHVRLTYRLEIPDGATVLSFSALETSPIEELSATVSGENLILSQERSDERFSGTVALPSGARSPFILEFQYRVLGARIPVIVLDVTPGEARSGAFTARVELPAGTAATVDFPSNGVRDETGALAWELPVLPAFLSWGGAPRVREVSSSVREAGFAFWGLFAVNGAIALLYVVWMRRAT